ncbi:unnamed protein product [Rotaria sordida]|uniref:HAT C-terminal dimerisation domain-containing protein n=1 Tax=Rotaria sordida TaxID=392033 RepID=A0A819AUY2_9BILA|nr:unnamed protein product [Rotaria sordida]
MAERNQNLMILSTNEKSETSNNETRGGGASMELDRICEGFSNIINNINDIREGLSDEGTRYLFEEIKNNIAIIPPLTFLLPDKQEKKECKTDPTKAVCIACNVQFSIENSVLGDINRHIQRKKHQECVKSVESNRSKTVDTMFHIPTSDLQKLCAAEGTLVFHGIKHSHSYVSQACTVKLVKKCLLGSSITKNINCNRTKAREIACNVLAPSLTYALVLELRDVTFFSIAYDSSNRGNSKMLPIVVQFFSKFGVKHGLLEFIEQQTESADALFNNIKYVLEENELKLSQVVSIGSYNTNVNVGNNHSVFSLFNQLVPYLIKGYCYSHILHNSVKHGNEYLLFDVEAALLKIYAHFCRSTVILKHIRLRWLNLLPSIERLIVVHPVVKSYFLNLEHDECPNLLFKFFTSNEANVLPEVQVANLSLQREHTTGLNNRLKDNFFGCKVGQLLKNIQSSNQVEDLKKSCRSFIRSIIDYIEKYYNSSAAFYQSISIFSEIDIEKIQWKDIQQCCTFIHDIIIDEDGLYNDFNHIRSKYISLREKSGGIVKQVESFILSNLGASKQVVVPLYDEDSVHDDDECDLTYDSDSNDDDERNAKCHKEQEESLWIRSDYLWAFLLHGERVPNLQRLVQFVFAIPVSNAYCETVFSHMKYLWNNNRNRMKQDLVGAELKIKMNTNYTCTEFYDYLLNKPDLLKEIRSSNKYSHIAKVPRTA